VDWIRLDHDRDRWRAVVSAVMKFRVLAPRSYLVSSLVCYLVSKILVTSLVSWLVSYTS
jgi:hypothetical protein